MGWVGSGHTKWTDGQLWNMFIPSGSVYSGRTELNWSLFYSRRFCQARRRHSVDWCELQFHWKAVYVQNSSWRSRQCGRMLQIDWRGLCLSLCLCWSGSRVPQERIAMPFKCRVVGPKVARFKCGPGVPRGHFEGNIPGRSRRSIYSKWLTRGQH